MCRYCNNWKLQKANVFRKIEHWELNITIYDKGITPELYIGNPYEQISSTFPINYCPFCGKDLK